MTEPWDIDEAFGFWLHRAFNGLRVRTLARFREAGFDGTPEQWALLVRLWREDGLTQTDLADRTFRDPAGVTRLVDALAGRGLVRRGADPTDRRVRRVWLTPEGRALEDVLVPVARSLVEELMDGLDPEAVRITRDTLRALAGRLDA